MNSSSSSSLTVFVVVIVGVHVLVVSRTKSTIDSQGYYSVSASLAVKAVSRAAVVTTAIRA